MQKIHFSESVPGVRYALTIFTMFDIIKYVKLYKFPKEGIVMAKKKAAEHLR